jgi:hypothetical protein
MRRPPNVPPGDTHDGRNFRLEDYLQMCRNGEAKFSMAEVARVAGVSRAELYRWREMASYPEAEFEAALDALWSRGRRGLGSTAVCDELRRRTGRAKVYTECCPNCGIVLRERRR